MQRKIVLSVMLSLLLFNTSAGWARVIRLDAHSPSHHTLRSQQIGPTQEWHYVN